MVSATCPACHILLVEANSTTVNDLGTGVNTAVRLGAKFVSNSYGGREAKGEATKYNHFYNHPGVAVTVVRGRLRLRASTSRHPRGTSPRSAARRCAGRRTSAAGPSVPGPGPALAAPGTAASRAGSPRRAAARPTGPSVTCPRSPIRTRASRCTTRSRIRRRPQRRLERRGRHECLLADHRRGVRAGRQPGEEHLPGALPVQARQPPVGCHWRAQRHVLARVPVQRGERLRRPDRPRHAAHGRWVQVLIT